MARAPRVRRARSVTESLLSIVLGLEVVLVFFVTLTVYGLVKTVPAWAAFTGGAVLMLLLVIAAGTLRWRIGVGLGWALQLALILTGLLLPAMYVVGAGFAGIWIFCVVKSRQIEAQKRAWLAANPAEAPASPTPDPHPEGTDR